MKVRAIGGANAAGKPIRLRGGLLAFNIEPSGFEEVVLRFNKAQKAITLRKLSLETGVEVAELPDGTKFGDVDYLMKSCSLLFDRYRDLDLIVASFPFLMRDSEHGLPFSESRSVQAADRGAGIVVLSEDDLDTYAKRADRSYTDTLAFLLIGELARLLAGVQNHSDTRGCIMDYCEIKDEVVAGLRRYTFDEECRRHLIDATYGPAILRLAARFGHPRWWQDQSPVLWTSAALFSAGLAFAATDALISLATPYGALVRAGAILAPLSAFLLAFVRTIRRK